MLQHTVAFHRVYGHYKFLCVDHIKDWEIKLLHESLSVGQQMWPNWGKMVSPWPQIWEAYFFGIYYSCGSNRWGLPLKHRIILAGAEYLRVTQRQALPQKACNQSILDPFNRWLNRGGDLLRNKYFFFNVPEGDLRENTVYFESNSLADGDGNIETLIAM